MLQEIRERAQGWIAWFIVILISVPFALWGISSYLDGGSTQVVASVNGQDITEREFENGYRQYRQRVREQLGSNYRPELIDETRMREEFLSSMIRDRLVLGVSSAPILGELAWARRGGGAFLDGKPIRTVACETMAEAAVSTGNLKSLAAGKCWNVLGEVAREANRLRGYGDFFHYHLLARGALDVVIESDVNILDVAALAVIIEEAGGVFTDLDGRALDLDTRSVLAAGPTLHAQLKPRFEGWRA